MKIAILTGAGISAESGLGTFRDVDGLWTKYDLEEVATPEGFARNPALVQAFYNARRANCISAAPHAAHVALARLEKSHHDLTLITQNIDDLHERAGSTNVIQVPYHMDRLMQAVSGCDLFVAIGTSGEVYPAAGLVDLATETGADTLEINLEASSRASAFARAIFGPASQTVPAWVDDIVAQGR